jgi:hypothetical protein
MLLFEGFEGRLVGVIYSLMAIGSMLSSRWLPEKSFPPYAYLPGRQPHPVRDPAGHSYHVEPMPVAAEASLGSDVFLWGLDLFNHGYYWEAHEAWEGLWQVVDRGGPCQGRVLGPIVRHEPFFAIGLDEAEPEEESVIFCLLHSPGLPCGMAVAGERSRATLGMPASLSVVKGPPLRLGERKTARFQATARTLQISEPALESSQEPVRIESLRHPFDVAPLKAREAAPVAALETEVRKEIRFLYACRGERAWIDVQAVPYVILSPLQPRYHSFDVAAICLRGYFTLRRRMWVATVHGTPASCWESCNRNSPIFAQVPGLGQRSRPLALPSRGGAL